MVEKASPPRSIKKYAILGAIGVIAIAAILIALAYNTPGPKTVQDSTSATSGNPVPQGATAGAGKDNPGPNDGGGISDTNPKPIPSPIVAASIEVTPSIITVDTATTGSNSVSANIGGDGFHPNQTIKITLDNVTSLQTDPSPLTSSGTGGFSADKIMIPTDTAKGNHTVIAIDQSGKSAKATFALQ
jgi:hypothetical protein